LCFLSSVFHKNVLLTVCRDKMTRIWSETSLEESIGFYLSTFLDPLHSSVFFFTLIQL